MCVFCKYVNKMISSLLQVKFNPLGCTVPALYITVGSSRFQLACAVRFCELSWNMKRWPTSVHWTNSFKLSVDLKLWSNLLKSPLIFDSVGKYYSQRDLVGFKLSFMCVKVLNMVERINVDNETVNWSVIYVIILNCKAHGERRLQGALLA